MLHSPEVFDQWKPALFDGEFDWDFLEPAFMGSKIKPMDLDGIIERNGHFLCFETKKEGQHIGKGQSITLTALWKIGFSIFVIAGKTPKTISGMATYWEGAFTNGVKVGSIQHCKCNSFDVLYQTRRWLCRANGLEAPTRCKWDSQLWTWDYEREALRLPKNQSRNNAGTNHAR